MRRGQSDEKWKNRSEDGGAEIRETLGGSG